MTGKVLVIEWELPEELSVDQLRFYLTQLKRLNFRIIMGEGTAYDTKNLNKFGCLKDEGLIDDFFRSCLGAPGNYDLSQFKNYHYIISITDARLDRCSTRQEGEYSGSIEYNNRYNHNFSFLTTNTHELLDAFRTIITLNSGSEYQTIDYYGTDLASIVKLYQSTFHKKFHPLFLGIILILISFTAFALSLWLFKLTLLVSFAVGLSTLFMLAFIKLTFFSKAPEQALSSPPAQTPETLPEIEIKDVEAEQQCTPENFVFDRFKRLMRSLRLYLWGRNSPDGKHFQYYYDILWIGLLKLLKGGHDPKLLLVELEKLASVSQSSQMRFRKLANICGITLIDSKLLFACDETFRERFKQQAQSDFKYSFMAVYLPESWTIIPKFLPSLQVSASKLVNERRVDPYQILGVTRNATAEEIYEAYTTRMSRKNLSPDDYRNINESYLLLSDPWTHMQILSTIDSATPSPLASHSQSSLPAAAAPVQTEVKDVHSSNTSANALA